MKINNMTKAKLERHNRGMCILCETPAVEGQLRCVTHRQQLNKEQSNYVNAKKAKGICVWGGCTLGLFSKSYCAAHAVENRERVQAVHQRRIDAGLCRQCLNPRINSTHCDLHAKLHAVSGLRSQQRKRSKQSEEYIKYASVVKHGSLGTCPSCDEPGIWNLQLPLVTYISIWWDVESKSWVCDDCWLK